MFTQNENIQKPISVSRRFFRLDFQSHFFIASIDKNILNEIPCNGFDYFPLSYQSKRNSLKIRSKNYLAQITTNRETIKSLFDKLLSLLEILESSAMAFQSGNNIYFNEVLTKRFKQLVSDVFKFSQDLSRHSPRSAKIFNSMVGRLNANAEQLFKIAESATYKNIQYFKLHQNPEWITTEAINKMIFQVREATPLLLFFLDVSQLIDHYTASQKYLVIDLTGKHQVDEWESGVINVSEGGMRVSTLKEIKVNSKVDVSFHLPIIDRYADVEANVEGVEHCKNTDKFITRLNFLFPSKEAQAKIRAEINHQEFKR